MPFAMYEPTVRAFQDLSVICNSAIQLCVISKLQNLADDVRVQIIYKIRNRSAPSTDPCGTLLRTKIQSELTPSMHTR